MRARDAPQPEARLAAHEQIDRMLRRVESRAAMRAELGAVARGIFGTAAIFIAIVSILLLVIVGAIVFATVMSAFAQ